MAEDYAYPKDTFILLGKITKVHGLRGEVKIFSYSGQPENFSGYKEIVLVDPAGNLSSPLVIRKLRVQGKTCIVQLDSVYSRELAEKIVGRGVLLAKNLLPMPVDNEFYWHQYEGKVVSLQDGRNIGRVESLFNNGAQDILVVVSGEKEILIPVTKDIIVRETAAELIVDPPPGLLDLAHDSAD